MHELTKILTISDFNAELVSRYLSADQSLPICSAVTAEYGQVSQTLAGFSHDKDLTAFVWTRPEGVIPEYLKVLDRETVQNDRLLAGASRVSRKRSRTHLFGMRRNRIPNRRS